MKSAKNNIVVSSGHYYTEISQMCFIAFFCFHSYGTQVILVTHLSFTDILNIC